MTPEEHTRTSMFREQLEAARRSVSPPAGRSEDAQEDAEDSKVAAAHAGASTCRATQPAAAPRKQRASSLPPAQRSPAAAEHHYFDDSITWWRSADAGALNAPPARQAARAATVDAPPKTAAEWLADEVEAAVRGRSLPATPPVWRDETGALHRARPHA